MDLSKPFCDYPYKGKKAPIYLDCPKPVPVGDYDTAWTFFVTIPNNRGNTPLTVCKYHYWIFCKKNYIFKKVDGVFVNKEEIVRTIYWSPLIWTPWGSDFMVQH